MRLVLKSLQVVSVIGMAAVPAWAVPAPGAQLDKVFTAETTKRGAYLSEGLVIGGDQAINDVIVLDIRHARNKEFERVVVDLEGNRDGEPAAIQRPPYYQVALSPDQSRAVFTVWGSPRLAFDSKRVLKTFQRSGLVKRVDLMPLVEKDRWMFVLNFKKAGAVEVFELKDPVRVILDIKSR